MKLHGNVIDGYWGILVPFDVLIHLLKQNFSALPIMGLKHFKTLTDPFR
ncbi:hypothetical protein [Paenibacillus sp. 1A_MP2]